MPSTPTPCHAPRVSRGTGGTHGITTAASRSLCLDGGDVTGCPLPPSLCRTPADPHPQYLFTLHSLLWWSYTRITSPLKQQKEQRMTGGRKRAGGRAERAAGEATEGRGGRQAEPRPPPHRLTPPPQLHAIGLRVIVPPTNTIIPRHSPTVVTGRVYLLHNHTHTATIPTPPQGTYAEVH